MHVGGWGGRALEAEEFFSLCEKAMHGKFIENFHNLREFWKFRGQF